MNRLTEIWYSAIKNYEANVHFGGEIGAWACYYLQFAENLLMWNGQTKKSEWHAAYEYYQANKTVIFKPCATLKFEKFAHKKQLSWSSPETILYPPLFVDILGKTGGVCSEEIKERFSFDSKTNRVVLQTTDEVRIEADDLQRQLVYTLGYWAPGFKFETTREFHVFEVPLYEYDRIKNRMNWLKNPIEYENLSLFREIIQNIQTGREKVFCLGESNCGQNMYGFATENGNAEFVVSKRFDGLFLDRISITEDESKTRWTYIGYVEMENVAPDLLKMSLNPNIWICSRYGVRKSNSDKPGFVIQGKTKVTS